MRTDKYMMAKAWMKQDQAPQSEALETWNTLEAEFNEERKAMLMASAESDKIKEAMNKKFGPGTVKYGSEIPQPEIKTPQAIFEFSQRNPAADGGRMEFGRGKKVLDKTEKKNVLNWGKNKSKALGETWSDKKTLKEYNNLSRFNRSKIRSGTITGEGIPGFKKKGDVRPLTKEQQKLWDATMADKVGKWEDYGIFDRGNWLRDFDKRLDQYNQTKNLLSREELSNFLTEKLGKEFSSKKISGVRSGSEKSKFGQYVDDKLFATEFGDGQQKYYKKPTDAQIKFIKQNLLEGGMKNNLNKNTVSTIKKIDSLYGSIYRSGELPDLKIMMQKLNLTGNQIAYAEAQLARIYGGHKFNNGPDIRINKKTSSDMFDIIAKSGFGNPRKNQVYQISLELIDEGLGNEKGTFRNLKNKAVKILHDNKIDVYDPKKGNKAVGFNIDEFAGVTGSGKSQNIGVSQFINIMEGNLNTKTLASFQGGLSKARAAVEAAKGTPRYNSVLKEQMELINTRAANLEAEYGIKLARLERPADINNMSKDEVKRLKNIKLGTDENLYQRLVKDAKASGYSIKVPEGSLTIQEFTDPNNARARELIALVGCPNFKGKQAFAEGGRTGFSEGGDCFDKGQKIINSAQVKSPAAQKNLAKLINGLAKTGTFAKNALKFGVVPEALFVGAESIIRAGGDQTLDEGFKSAIGFYTDWTGKTNFKADARASQNLRNIGLDGTINIEMLNEMRDASEQVKKLESNQKNVLSVYDESLMGESEQDYKKRSDQQIEDAKKYLSTKYLTDSQKNFYTSQENEAIDIAGTRSPFKKFLGKARSDTEMMRYENDPTGMQSDMFTLDPMSAKAKRDSVKNLPLRNQLSGSPGETAFMNLSQLPKGPRQGSEIDDLVTASNAQFKAQGVDTRVNSSVLKAIQDTKQNFKNMTMEEMIQAGLPMEAILGFNQPEVIKQKPMYDYAEGGITGLRSKYEYKK